MDYHQYIVRDPKVCGGEPLLKGTRVTVRTILASLAEGDRVQDLLKDFPTLKEEDVRAVVAFCSRIRRRRSPTSERAGPSVKIKLDEHLPVRLHPMLTKLAHVVFYEVFSASTGLDATLGNDAHTQRNVNAPLKLTRAVGARRKSKRRVAATMSPFPLLPSHSDRNRPHAEGCEGNPHGLSSHAFSLAGHFPFNPPATSVLAKRVT